MSRSAADSRSRSSGPARAFEVARGESARVGQQTAEPCGPAGDVEELGVVVDLAQAELRELEGLVARTRVQRTDRAFPGGGDHVVELPGAARVMRDRGEVVAVRRPQRVERGVMQVSPFASEEIGLDGFAYECVAKREHIRLGLDE